MAACIAWACVHSQLCMLGRLTINASQIKMITRGVHLKKQTITSANSGENATLIATQQVTFPYALYYWAPAG